MIAEANHPVMATSTATVTMESRERERQSDLTDWRLEEKVGGCLSVDLRRVGEAVTGAWRN